LPEGKYIDTLKLDMDTKRLLALNIDDILFADADKWVKQIEEADYITNEVARTTSTRKNRFLKDEISDSLSYYKTERMRYMGILKDYQNRLSALQEYQKQKAIDKAAGRTTLESIASESDRNSIWADLARVIDDIPQSNALIGAEYLEEGRVRKFLAAQTFLDWIYRAFGSGAIVPGEGLERKLAECNKQASELETNYQELVREYTLLEAEDSQLQWDYNMLYQQYHIHYPQSGRGQ
jgi:hypothetical protein